MAGAVAGWTIPASSLRQFGIEPGYAEPMPLKKLVQDAGNVAIYRATWGGSQNFLGARWVERVVDNSPEVVRDRVAMRFLSLSPHYFYDRDINQHPER